MNDKYAMLRHFLAALAYRTRKALRGAPSSFGDFDAGSGVRCPRELVRHMTSVLGRDENFIVADIRVDRVGPDQAAPVSPDERPAAPR